MGENGALREAMIRTRSGLHLRLRFLGSGPAVVLLHESPRSSHALLPLAERIADRFTCVMFDSPGFGLSDPLPMRRPEIPDFAEALLEAFEPLGLGPVPVYGTHTGAAVAAAMAVADPERVSAAVLDGYAAFTPAEQAELLASYLPPFRPALDGTHVAWLWARVRDQFTAFPWNRVSDGSRLPFGPPPLGFVQAVAEDFLRAGDHYRTGYAAAFRYDHLEPLRRARVPVRLACREDDLLFPHMDRAKGAGATTTLHPMSADRDAWGRGIGDLLGAHVGAERTDAAAMAARAGAAAGARQRIDTPAGAAQAGFEGPKAGAPVVLLHEVPGNSDDLDGLSARLARRGRRVLRLDLPGSGHSRLAPEAPATVETVVRGTAAALSALGMEGAPVVAHGAALAVALRLPGAPRVLALDPWPAVAEGAAEAVPDLAPRWDAAHLTAAWWWARDHEVYKPFTHRVNAEGRSVGPERDAERIHNRFRAVVLGGESGADVAKALYRADLAGPLAAAKGRAEALLHDCDPDFDALRAWADGVLGADRVHSSPREPVALAEAVDAALGRLG